MDLTDEQWAAVAPHLPERTSKRDRPRRDDREILNGILRIMRTGAPWADIPTAIRPTKPVIAASKSGLTMVPWNASCGHWSTTSKSVAT